MARGARTMRNTSKTRSVFETGIFRRLRGSEGPVTTEVGQPSTETTKNAGLCLAICSLPHTHVSLKVASQFSQALTIHDLAFCRHICGPKEEISQRISGLRSQKGSRKKILKLLKLIPTCFEILKPFLCQHVSNLVLFSLKGMKDCQRSKGEVLNRI